MGILIRVLMLRWNVYEMWNWDQIMIVVSILINQEDGTRRMISRGVA